MFYYFFVFFVFEDFVGCAFAKAPKRTPFPRRRAKALAELKPNAIAPLTKPTKAGEVRNDTRTPFLVLFKHL